MSAAAIPFRFGPATRRVSYRSLRQLRAIFANLQGKGGFLARVVSGENIVRRAESLRWRRVQPVMAARSMIDTLDIKRPLLYTVNKSRQYLNNLIERGTKEGARKAAFAAREKIWTI